MRIQALLGAVFTAATIFASTQGCSSSTEATPGGAGVIKCTPGNYVFCRCADRTEGTKLCKEDGASFEACSTGGAGECAGGEDLTDPNEGEPVDPPVGDAGPPGSPVDACPGKATAITAGAEIILEGDTTGAKDDAKGKLGACAAGAGGPDHVYHLQPTGSGSLSIKVQAEGALNPTVYVRSKCVDEESQSACAPPLGAGKLVQQQINVTPNGEYYLVVDGASGSAGKYKLTMKLTTGAFCGDGKVDPNEACDDGNKVEDDGCSNGCVNVNGNPAGGDCAAPHQVHLWKGKTVTGTGATLTYGNTFTKPGTSCDPAIGANAAQDHVYEVTAHAAGTMTVTMTPTEATYNVQLVARKTCADAATQVGDTASKCNAGSAGVAETLTIPVTNGEKVYVAADGALNAKGSYTIQFKLP